MKKKSNQARREFIKKSTMLTGAVLASPLMSKGGFNYSVDDAIKVAVIGCGGRGTGAAMQALSTKYNVKLVAMADAFRDNLDKCYKSLTADEVSDWSGVKGNIRDKIDVPEERKFIGFDGYKKATELADVVILTAPPGFRPIHFKEAVEKGKHVFMEKPLAVDPVGVRTVLEAAKIAKSKKLNVVVGLQRRYQNSYKALYERKDLIGDIVAGQVWWNNDGVWVRKRQPGQTEMEYQMRNWYYFNWLCGDHINEQHIHNIDVMNWFKGSFPIKAQGMGGREVRKGKDHGEIYDHHYVEFQYEDGSIMNSQCRHIPNTMSKVDELLIGTKGKIFCGAATIKDHSGNTLFQFDKKTENNPYQTEHDEIFEAISKGIYKFDDTEHGAKSTMTAILGRMATYSGKMIEWDKAINSNLDLSPSKYAWDANPSILPNADGFYPVAIPGVTKMII